MTSAGWSDQNWVPEEPIVLLLVGAVCLGLSFPPYFLVPLFVPALACVYAGLRDIGSEAAVRGGFLFGALFYLVHAYWFASFHPLALPAILAISGLWFGLWARALVALGVNPWTFAGSWMLLQLLIGTGYLALPWSRLATVLAVKALWIQPVHWMGELAWGGMLVLGCALIVEGYRGGRRSRLVLVAVTSGILVLLGLGYERLQRRHPSSVGPPVLMVQPNVPSRFGGGGVTRQNQRLRELTNENVQPGDLVLWPETVLPPRTFRWTGARLEFRSPFLRRKYERFLEGFSLLAGMVLHDPRPRALDYLNGAVLLDRAADPSGFYTKRHPVPAGEHLPMMGQWDWVHTLGRWMGTLGYRPGDLGGIIEYTGPGGPLRIGVQICFEAAFPGMVRRQVRNGADLLVNLSNDSWSRSRASHWQHFYRARVRAVETGRTMLRNGNTGVTAIVDPLGRIRGQLAPYRTGVVRGRVVRPLGETLFVRWGRWIPLGLALAFLAVGILVHRSGDPGTRVTP